MPLEFVKSEKGNDRLFRFGFLFYKEKETAEKIYWKCTEYKHFCKARIITEADCIIKESDIHNHAAEASFVEKEKIVLKIKEQAKVEGSPSCQVLIANNCSNTTEEVAAKMPHIQSFKRTIRRIRQNSCNYPSNPTSIDQFDILAPFNITEKNENFLLYDSGRVQNRILIFSTQKNLMLLKNSKHWFGDGTFDACPTLFAQLYTIHAMIDDSIIPLVYALLPGKSSSIYRYFLTELSKLCPELMPDSFLIDLEQAMIKAISEVFESCSIRLCFFHFSQCIYRKLSSFRLKTKYDTDSAFAQKVKMLSALAFVPPNDVEGIYDQLYKNEFTDVDTDFQDFLFSFEDEFIGRIDRRNKKRSARFSFHLWNQTGAVDLNLPKTNNNIKDWHRGFNEIIGKKNPTLWHFIASIKKEQGRNELRIVQIINHVEGPPQKKKYKDTAKKLKQIINKYNDLIYNDKITFLKTIAFNLHY